MRLIAVSIFAFFALALGAQAAPQSTEQAASVACSTQNYLDWGPVYDDGDCIIGTTITVSNALWFCAKPLSQYGALPIRVLQTWSIAAPVGQNGIEIRTGCSGDGTPAIDLIVVQNLVGVGRISDPFKTRMNPGPQDVDVTGVLNASGPDAVPGAGDHQDCIQLQGGRDNDFVNIKGCGDYAAGVSNTQAAGGTVFFSLNNSHARILGGEYIGCNHSLYAFSGEVAPGSLVKDAKFRSGNNSTSWCSYFNTSSPCVVNDPDLALENVTCGRWRNGAWVDTVINPTNPPPPPPPPPVLPACSDGLDNDGDGKIDYPADPGCADLLDNDETDPPPPSGGFGFG